MNDKKSSGVNLGHQAEAGTANPVSQAGFTPGPWHYQEGSDSYTHIVRDSANRYICGCSQDSGGRAEANARLIAAAPELLAALKDMLRYGQHKGVCTDSDGDPLGDYQEAGPCAKHLAASEQRAARARAIIAKAEGLS